MNRTQILWISALALFCLGVIGYSVLWNSEDANQADPTQVADNQKQSVQKKDTPKLVEETKPEPVDFHASAAADAKQLNADSEPSHVEQEVDKNLDNVIALLDEDTDHALDTEVRNIFEQSNATEEPEIENAEPAIALAAPADEVVDDGADERSAEDVIDTGWQDPLDMDNTNAEQDPDETDQAPVAPPTGDGAVDDEPDENSEDTVVTPPDDNDDITLEIGVPEVKKPEPGGEWKVKEGDTLSSIAKEVYGKASVWPKLQEANPDIDPNRLQIGQKVQLPPSEDVLPKSTTQGAGDEQQTVIIPPEGSITHEVKANESLWAISAEHYGTGRHWRYIFEANKHVMGDDPDKLEEGMKLIIPPKPE